MFPRDFIINIPAPTNYIGPEKVFGTSIVPDETNNDLLPIVFPIKDYDYFVPQGHKKDDDKPTFSDIPESLKTAIKCFIVTCAVRIARGQETKHNSMLIHISRFQLWQNHIKELVENLFNFYKHEIEAGDSAIYEEFRKILEDDTANYKSFRTVTTEIQQSRFGDIDKNLTVHSWDEIKPLLYKAVQKVEIKSINGTSGDCLTYYENEKTGISVIAIGGDKLSRGLTLEGLSVSYYLRASRMYDTLMQMGRWFGYRPGYVDLCRLFTSRELNEWFCHITLASEELRSEFEYMSDVAGSTPEQYALRVRTHPGVLQISASNKIRRAVNVDISWAGRLVESYQLQKTPKIVQSNLEASRNLINSLPSSFSTKDNHILWKNISAELVKPFFQNFKVSESLKKVDPLNLLSFIDISNRSGELINWNIAIRFKKDAEFNYDLNSTNGISQIGCIVRTSDPEKNDNNNLNIRKNHIISPKDEFFDLTEEEYKKGLERTKELNKDYKNDFPKGEIVRNEIRKPTTALLILYFLNPEKAGYSGSEPIVGFAVSFPRSIVNPTVQFAVHEQLLSRFDINDDVENDNTDED